MKTISKLLLTTAILATGAMAGGDPDPVEGTFAAGLNVEAASAGFVVGSGTTVQNNGTADVSTVGVYTESGAIDVQATDSAYGKLMGAKNQSRDHEAYTPGTDGGTVVGDVARHWNGGGVDWNETVSNSQIFNIGANATGEHGFISNGLNMSGATLYEVLDDGNKLARLYRNVDSNDQLQKKEISSVETVATANLAVVDISAPSTLATALASHTGEYQTLGTICYSSTATGGPNSLDPAATFKIDTSIDSAASSTENTVKAKLDTQSGVSTLQLVTGYYDAIESSEVEKPLTFTPDVTDAKNDLPENLVLGVNSAQVAHVTFGTGGFYHDVSGTLKAGIAGNLTAHGGTGNDAVFSTLTISESTPFALGGNWTFKGKSRLDSSARITVATGTEMIFGDGY